MLKIGMLVLNAKCVGFLFNSPFACLMMTCLILEI